MKFVYLQSFFLLFLLTSCAYTWGPSLRSLPGNHRKIAIPIFKNKTMEPGIEVSMTNSLRHEFNRSNEFRVQDEKDADVIVVGEVRSIKNEPGGPRTSSDSNLPLNTVLATSYTTILGMHVKLIRKIDGFVYWESDFQGVRAYSAPQVTLSGVNSVNPIYNLSARRQNIESMTNDMMSEVYDRLTENF